MGPRLVLVPGGAARRVAGGARDHAHTGGQPGGDANLAILDHQAALRGHAELASGLQVAVGVRLAAQDVLGADGDREVPGVQAQGWQCVLELAAGRTSDDRHRERGGAGEREDLPGSGQHPQHRALAEEDLLGRDGAGDYRVQVDPEALAESQVGVDLMPTETNHVERLGPADQDAAIATKVSQTGGVDHLAIDQGAIEVKE